MIHEAIDAAFAIWEALVVFAFVGTVVLLAGLVCGTWAVKRAWRVFGPHARRARCAPAGAPDGVSRGSGDAGTPPEASEAPSGHAPSWAQTDRKAA